MLVKEIMTRKVVWCTPEDTVCHAANLMKVHGVGAIPVVWNLADPLVEGIVTDRDLCCGVLAGGKHGETVTVAEIMTPVPVTCEPEATIDECEELMQENQVRRIPVVDKRGRCVGIMSLADIALHARTMQVALTVKEISRPTKEVPLRIFEKDRFYCGQSHEEDEILLLNRRRELHKLVKV